VRWLSKNRDSLLSAFYHALAYICMLIFGYGLVISQNYVFMRGIELDTKTLPSFNHELAETTYKYLQNFHVANSYGLFRQMTGVVGGRPELVIQGSNDYNPEKGEAGKWKEYEVSHKPTSVHQIPRFLMPHQPRFAWQLWFSALENIETEFYLNHFLYKLLNDDPVAKSLLSLDPFPNENVKFVKIDLDHYQFTDYKKERVTFGVKHLLTKTRLVKLFPLEF
jgi:hypothetical protein